MSDYLSNLVARVLETAPVLQPRRPLLFEPVGRAESLGNREWGMGAGEEAIFSSLPPAPSPRPEPPAPAVATFPLIPPAVTHQAPPIPPPPAAAEPAPVAHTPVAPTRPSAEPQPAETARMESPSLAQTPRPVVTKTVTAEKAVVRQETTQVRTAQPAPTVSRSDAVPRRLAQPKPRAELTAPPIMAVTPPVSTLYRAQPTPQEVSLGHQQPTPPIRSLALEKHMAVERQPRASDSSTMPAGGRQAPAPDKAINQQQPHLAARPPETPISVKGQSDDQSRPMCGQPTSPVAARTSRPVVSPPVAPRASRDEPVTPAPSIHVHIGRIEVRATPPPSPAAKSRPQPVLTSLDDYLRQRSGGNR